MVNRLAFYNVIWYQVVTNNISQTGHDISLLRQHEHYPHNVS